MFNDLICEMVDAGGHYGHQTKKRNPRMRPYLMKDKGGALTNCPGKQGVERVRARNRPEIALLEPGRESPG